MRIDIVTLFPGMVEPGLSDSIVGRARERGLVDIRVHNLRDWAPGKHRVTDDTPFGGGGGMIMKPEPLAACIETIRAPGARVILLDPAGRRLTQDVARELSERPHLVLLCGRYEGVDERVRERLVDEELSIGDYVLTGGAWESSCGWRAAKASRCGWWPRAAASTWCRRCPRSWWT